MDEFADFIQNVEAPPQPHKPVTIALIDDGVNINEQCLYNKIVGGQSFCHRDEFQNLSKPYYVTSGGHGTVMASMICRVFPMAQLYIVKLDEYLSEHSKRQITAKSAAKASPHSPPSLGVQMELYTLADSQVTGRSSSNRQTSTYHLDVLDDRTHPTQ